MPGIFAIQCPHGLAHAHVCQVVRSAACLGKHEYRWPASAVVMSVQGGDGFL